MDMAEANDLYGSIYQNLLDAAWAMKPVSICFGNGKRRCE